MTPVLESSWQRAVIFANGDLRDPNSAVARLQSGDYIIAADGGAYHCTALGLTPEVIIGDFDSVDSQTLSVLEQQGSRLLRFSPRKDHTDLELALIHAHQQNLTQALIFAAIGSRWDMTLANILLPVTRKFQDLQIRLVDGSQELFVIHPGSCVQLEAQPSDTVSLIPVGGDVTGIITHGLEYPLKAETLHFGTTRGISNVVTNPQPCIETGSGLLLCILIRSGAAHLEP